MRLGVRLVQERFGAEHAIIGQGRISQEHAVAADKTIIAHANRMRDLAILRDVDGVRNELGLKSGDDGEATDGDGIGAIEEMAMSDGGMFAYDQLGPAFCLTGEMTRIAQRKAGNPIPAADRRVSFQMQQAKILCHGKMTNAGVLFHDQTRRQNPGQTNVSSGMNLKTKLLLQKRAPHLPRQQQRNELEKILHAAIPNPR